MVIELILGVLIGITIVIELYYKYLKEGRWIAKYKFAELSIVLWGAWAIVSYFQEQYFFVAANMIVVVSYLVFLLSEMTGPMIEDF